MKFCEILVKLKNMWKSTIKPLLIDKWIFSFLEVISSNAGNKYHY